MSVAARIQAYLRDQLGQCEVVTISPFTALFHPTESELEASYAMPDVPADGDLAVPLAELRAAFAARGRIAHIRFLDMFAPALPAILQSAGFVEIQRQPVLVCDPATLCDVSELPGLSVVVLSEDSPLDEVREGLDANAIGFDPQAAPASPAEAEAFRRTLVTSRAFTVRLDGQPAGAGMFIEIRDGITELVGITTLGPFRGRGIARYLTAHMARLAFQQGADTVFLTSRSAEAARVYERAGFRLCGSLVAFST